MLSDRTVWTLTGFGLVLAVLIWLLEALIR